MWVTSNVISQDFAFGSFFGRPLQAGFIGEVQDEDLVQTMVNGIGAGFSGAGDDHSGLSANPRHRTAVPSSGGDYGNRCVDDCTHKYSNNRREKNEAF